MKIKPFELERYFAKYEFSAKYLLSSSDCDGLTLNEVLGYADDETKQLWDGLQLAYTESLGLPLLREEIAKLYTNIKPDEIVTIVPEEGIFITMNCLLNAGDNVICTFPGYQSLYQIANSLGCTVTRWEPNEEDNWRFDPQFLEDQIKPNTKLIVINFPHNPTGYYPSKEDFEKIIEIAKKHNVYVFSDEMYRFLEFNADDRVPSTVDVYDKAIVLFGMSKTFGLAGLRLGWLVTKDKKLFDEITNFKDYTTICGSAPSEILALVGLRAKNKIIAKNLEKIQKNLAIADDFMNRHNDLFNWIKPKAGTIAFPKLLNGSSYEFCQKVVEQAGIMLLPSKVYGYDDNHFRVGFGRENFPEALGKLEEFLES